MLGVADTLATAPSWPSLSIYSHCTMISSVNTICFTSTLALLVRSTCHLAKITGAAGFATPRRALELQPSLTRFTPGFLRFSTDIALIRLFIAGKALTMPLLLRSSPKPLLKRRTKLPTVCLPAASPESSLVQS